MMRYSFFNKIMILVFFDKYQRSFYGFFDKIYSFFNKIMAFLIEL